MVEWRRIGTALAAIYVAVEKNKRIEVFVDETRPLLQGSRLTAWELQRAGIPFYVAAPASSFDASMATGVEIISDWDIHRPPYDFREAAA